MMVRFHLSHPNKIKNYSKKEPLRTSEFWKSWQKLPKKELLTKGFFTDESIKAQKKATIETVLIGITVILYIFVIPVFSIFGGTLGLIVYGLSLPIIIGSFLIILILKQLMSKRASIGNKELAGWLAFKKWLKEYSVTKNYPIDSVILWEKYLVYGIALGISIKALSQLSIKYTEAFNNSGIYLAVFNSSNTSLSNINNFQSSFGALTTSLNSLSSGFNSYGASGVGSSGGFSGGGGGGGGGGGAG